MTMELVLLPIGMLIATISSMVGLGGGVFIIPLLVLFFGLPTQKAIGVSLLTMTFTTISATIAYARQRKIDYKVGLLLDILDVPGAILGAYMTTFIDSEMLATIFGGFLLIVSICIFSEVIHVFISRLINTTIDMIRRLTEKSKKHLPTPSYIKYKRFALPLRVNIRYRTLNLSKRVIYLSLVGSFASGVVAGMLGAGGGTVDESVMILALNMPIPIASGTSVFGMALTNIVAAISHAILGNILLGYAVPLIIGAFCGAQLGPLLSKRIESENLKKILAVVFAVIGLRMIIIRYLVL